jgi:glycosyltransferase involved in cell wall biosynthesis
MTDNKALSILIAAKDEELSISQVIESHISLIKKTEQQIKWEIGVLDDGSTDETLAVITSLQKKYPQLKIWHNDKPSGIANAFKQLANNAEHEWIYITSGDGQFTAIGFERMLESWLLNPITTLGVRTSRFSSYGIWRSFISFVFQVTTRIVFRVNLHDPGSVKIIKREVALADLKSKSTMRDAELLARAHHMSGGLQFVDIPFLPRNTGKASGIKPRNLIANLQDLFVLAFSSEYKRTAPQSAGKTSSSPTKLNLRKKFAKK